MGSNTNHYFFNFWNKILLEFFLITIIRLNRFRGIRQTFYLRQIMIDVYYGFWKFMKRIAFFVFGSQNSRTKNLTSIRQSYPDNFSKESTSPHTPSNIQAYVILACKQRNITFLILDLFKILVTQNNHNLVFTNSFYLREVVNCLLKLLGNSYVQRCIFLKDFN